MKFRISNIAGNWRSANRCGNGWSYNLAVDEIEIVQMEYLLSSLLNKSAYSTSVLILSVKKLICPFIFHYINSTVQTRIQRQIPNCSGNIKFVRPKCNLFNELVVNCLLCWKTSMKFRRHTLYPSI